MSTQPLISVVIATYNCTALLERTLLSVFDQKTDWELLLVDGGSTDGTVDIIRKHAQHVKWWVSEADKGIYDAWNKGITHASGEWILFLGAGDTLSANAFETYAAYARENPGLDYICARQAQVYDDGRIMRYKGAPWKWSAFQHRMTVTHVGSWHARAAFERYGLFDASYRVCGDYEWLLRPGQQLKAGFIDQVLAQMLVGGISDANDKVFTESSRAKIETAKRSVIVVQLEEFMARWRKKIRKWIYPS